MKIGFYEEPSFSLREEVEIVKEGTNTETITIKTISTIRKLDPIKLVRC